MNGSKFATIVAIGTLLATMGTSAFADHQPEMSPGKDGAISAASQKTRAKVITETRQARAQGLLNLTGDTQYPAVQSTPTTKSRAEVRFEAVHASHNATRDSLYNTGG